MKESRKIKESKGKSVEGFIMAFMAEKGRFPSPLEILQFRQRNNLPAEEFRK